jgi:ribosomal-protein-alanine N-acetyltransferase
VLLFAVRTFLPDLSRDDSLADRTAKIYNLKNAYFSNMLEVNFSPFPDLTTERLVLRKMSVEQDAQAMFDLRSNTQVMQYVSRPIAKSIDDSIILIEMILDLIANDNAINWAITLKENPSHMIGNIGIFNLQKENYRGEFGYMLHPDYWRRGIIQEAIACTVKFAFEKIKLHSLEAQINPLNIASAVVLEKNGFIKEAHFTENLFWNEEFCDTIVYGLLNK